MPTSCCRSNINLTRSYTSGEPDRYVVLIPRVVLDQSTEMEVFLKYLWKCLVVVGFLLCVAVFSAIRFLSQQTIDTSFFIHLVLDTFARSIGNSAIRISSLLCWPWDGALPQLLCQF